MKTFKLKIVTLDGEPFCGNAERLLVRTTEGDVEILAGHADAIATISAGRVKITAPDVFSSEKYQKGERLAAVSGGFLSVVSGEVKLVATTFEFQDEIDINRAKQAKEKAEAAIKRASTEREETLAKAKLLRALTRIDVSGIK